MFRSEKGTDVSGLLSLYAPKENAFRLTNGDLRELIANEVIDQVNQEFSIGVLQAPTDEDRQRIHERINTLVGLAIRRNNANPSIQFSSSLAADLSRRLLGLGFLDMLLPPTRTDLSEITIYSSGLIQVMKKGSVRWETVVDLKPEAHEIYRVLDRLLGPQNKSLNEANPSVNARLPVTPFNPGGGRVKALHPVIAPPGRNPSINIRLFEQKPVHPEWILERGMMSAEMMKFLQGVMEEGIRVLITGGTRTGKTTLLSALCNFLPAGWRIVKIEDPEEIWIDRPTVQTIEARPAPIGTEIKPYTLADGVDDALRMAPDYLIVGEVRDGRSIMSLFRSMMTGHSGACTFHADSSWDATHRLATVLGADLQVPVRDAHQTIVDAIDLIVQIGIRHEIRRVLSISSVDKKLKDGKVWLDPLFVFDENSPADAPAWEE